MFGLKKTAPKEKETSDAVRLTDLHVGCAIGFGFMPQKNISARRFSITATNSYLFETDSFITYHLQDAQTDINLIVAEGEAGTPTYLALSLRIDELLFAPLFVSELPPSWFSIKQGAVIDVASRMLGAPVGWLVPRYSVAIVTRGRMLEGDFRLRKPADRISMSREFDYVLLVDETNTHALEAELYSDGTMNVFATVYRSGTDIGEITRLAIPENISAQQQVLTARKEEASSPVESESKTDDLSSAQEVLPVHTKFGRIQPVSASAETSAFPETLAFDTRLAGRIIDEAQRNQMPISQLIRKVIDLPAQIQEQVLIPFSLTPVEYAELARRYELPVSDTQAVKERILEDLKNFVGIK
jgi:hypothetical protein